MAESANKIKRALISVSDKSGIVDLANALVNQFNIEIIENNEISHWKGNADWIFFVTPLHRFEAA